MCRIEFGHNDGGSPATSERAPTAGTGSETTSVTLADGTKEVVQTFGTYLKWMARDVLAKGGIPIISRPRMAMDGPEPLSDLCHTQRLPLPKST